MSTEHRPVRIYRAFGLTIAADFVLPGMTPVEVSTRPDVEVVLAERPALDAAWSGRSGQRDAVGRVQGGSFRFSRGKAGDHLLTYADRAVFHVSSRGDRVLCAPTEVDDPRWQRELLDTVLWSTALCRGWEALHASAVELNGAVVAIIAYSGGGKTSLAAELVRRGGKLFCDDVLMVKRAGPGIEAHPGPALMNLPANGREEAPAWLGEAVARIDDEIWVEVERAAGRPAPLAAICLLDRSSERTEIAPARLSPVDLRPHIFVHPLLPDREAARFTLSADLLEAVPAWRIRARERTPVRELGDLIGSLTLADRRHGLRSCSA